MHEETDLLQDICSNNASQVLLLRQLASSDDLIQKIIILQEDNSRIKRKMRSLKESALQVKQLYDEQYKKNNYICRKFSDLDSQVSLLKKRNIELEHSRINDQLVYSQAIAEIEAKLGTDNEQLMLMLKAMITFNKTQASPVANPIYREYIKTMSNFLHSKNDNLSIENQLLLELKRKRRRKEGNAVHIIHHCNDTTLESNNVYRNDSKLYFKDSEYLKKAGNHSDESEPDINYSTKQKMDAEVQVDLFPNLQCYSLNENIQFSISNSVFGTNNEAKNKPIDLIFQEMIFDVPKLLSPICEFKTPCTIKRNNIDHIIEVNQNFSENNFLHYQKIFDTTAKLTFYSQSMFLNIFDNKKTINRTAKLKNAKNKI